MQYEISRKLTATAVYKIQHLMSQAKAKARKGKRKFVPVDAAKSIAERFKLPVQNVEKICA